MSETVPQISVIVPCYNIQGYIGACLESLAAQTHGSFEVICIDDGSTDRTGKLLGAFAQQDARFRVIRFEKRKGPSAARNAGIKASTAPLIAFVDGDDVVSPYYLETLATLLEQTNADMACCAHRALRPGCLGELQCDKGVLSKALQHPDVLNAQEALEQVARDSIQLAFWGKLFRRDIAETHLFPEGKVFEDLWNLGGVVADLRKVALIHEPLYGYVYRENSITRVRPAPKRTFCQFRVAMEHFEEAYARCFGLEHATDNAAYCLHLVHRLCGQHTTLRNSKFGADEKASIDKDLLDELGAAYQLALLRGVPRTHPQMMRGFILCRAPALHDSLLRVYRRFARR